MGLIRSLPDSLEFAPVGSYHAARQYLRRTTVDSNYLAGFRMR
jgi:hypothetical protein